MVEDLRKLITHQINAIDQIKHVIINYKKLSKASFQKRNHVWLIYRRFGRKFDTSIMGLLLRQRLRTGRSYLISSKKNSTLLRMPAMKRNTFRKR